MGPDAAHGEGVWSILPQGGLHADGKPTMEETGRRMGLPSPKRCDGGGKFAGGGDLDIHPPEHRSAIYCN